VKHVSRIIAIYLMVLISRENYILFDDINIIVVYYKPKFDRLLKILELEEPDILPLYEHFVDTEIIEVLLKCSLKYSLDKRGNKIRYIKTLIKFYKNMGYDYVPLELGFKMPRKNVITTRDTAIFSRGMRNWQNESSGIIESLEDFYSFPWPDPDNAVDYELMKILCKEIPEDMGIVGGVAGGVLEHVMWIMGTRPFFHAIKKNEKLISLMFNTIGSLIFEVDKRLVEYEKVGILRMGDDMGYRHGTFISPQELRKYVFPWQKKCVDLAHKYDKPFILHSCGNLEKIMDDLINYVGIDAKHSFEDAIMPVTEAKKKYGDKIAILGGVDVDKLSRYSSERMAEYIKNIILECAPGGGYALGSGNTITNYVKLENYLLMIKLRDKYGRYPIRIS